MGDEPRAVSERIRYMATPESLAFSEKVAQRLGIDFNALSVAADAPFLLTSYYSEITAALGSPYSEVSFADFSRRQLSARAVRTASGRHYVHVDQHFDFWTFGLCVLWAHAALNGIQASDEDRFDNTWRMLLDQDGGGEIHETVREHLAPYILESGRALRVAHELSIACFAALVCHELAHHQLGHLDTQPGHAVEFEADLRGHDLMRQLCASDPRPSFTLIQPYSLAGSWVMLRLIEASERRKAQRLGLVALPPSPSHPAASDRLAALEQRFAEDRDQSSALRSFYDGFQPPWQAILAANGL